MIVDVLMYGLAIAAGTYAAYLAITKGSDVVMFSAGFLMVVIPGSLILRSIA